MNALKMALVPAAAGLACLSAAWPARADFVSLPVVAGANTTLTLCNPKINLDTPTETQDPSVTACRVEGLPGSSALPGYILRASRSANLKVNGVTVGKIYDRVWCKGAGTACDATNTYVLGLRVRLNTEPWNPTGNSFEINDFFRMIRPGSAAESAYHMGRVGGGTNPTSALAYKYVEYTGRTLKGLSEPASSGQQELNKLANNAWIDFRADVNANDPDSNPPFSLSSEWSPWMLVRQVCPLGVGASPKARALRVWQGGEEGQTPQSIYTGAYACN